MWYQYEDEEDEALMFSPALMARRASESWIDTPPVEVVRTERVAPSAAFSFFRLQNSYGREIDTDDDTCVP